MGTVMATGDDQRQCTCASPRRAGDDEFGVVHDEGCPKRPLARAQTAVTTSTAREHAASVLTRLAHDLVVAGEGTWADEVAALASRLDDAALAVDADAVVAAARDVQDLDAAGVAALLAHRLRFDAAVLPEALAADAADVAHALAVGLDTRDEELLGAVARKARTETRKRGGGAFDATRRAVALRLQQIARVAIDRERAKHGADPVRTIPAIAKRLAAELLVAAWDAFPAHERPGPGRSVGRSREGDLARSIAKVLRARSPHSWMDHACVDAVVTETLEVIGFTRKQAQNAIAST